MAYPPLPNHIIMDIIKLATDMSVREYWSSLGNGSISDCSTFYKRKMLNRNIDLMFKEMGREYWHHDIRSKLQEYDEYYLLGGDTWEETRENTVVGGPNIHDPLYFSIGDNKLRGSINPSPYFVWREGGAPA